MFETNFNQKEPRIDDQSYLDYLWRFERESLLRGKRRATDRYHAQIRRQPPAARTLPPQAEGTLSRKADSG